MMKNHQINMAILPLFRSKDSNMTSTQQALPDAPPPSWPILLTTDNYCRDFPHHILPSVFVFLVYINRIIKNKPCTVFFLLGRLALS